MAEKRIVKGTSKEFSFDGALKSALEQIRLPGADRVWKFKIINFTGEVGVGFTGIDNQGLVLEIEVTE